MEIILYLCTREKKTRLSTTKKNNIMKTLNFTGLNSELTLNVVNALAQLLADFQIHYTNLRNLHWNVRGHGFFIMHEKYEELYDDAAAKIDEIAERILQLDGTPESRFSAYLKVAKVQELDVPETGCNAVEYVLDTLKTLIAQEREVLRLAADAGDEVTVALMSDYLKEQEKTVWMLVAFNSPKCAK